eukprot:symbB.v1.2.036503.t1/scaffold5171.1/size30161/4
MTREAAEILGLPENFSEAPVARSFVWLTKAIHSKMSEVEWLQIDWLKACPSLAASVSSSHLQPEAVKISSRIAIHNDANSSDASELLQRTVFVISAADILLCQVTKKTSKEIADLYRYSEASGLVIDKVSTIVKNKLGEADKESKAISKAEVEAKESRAAAKKKSK